MTRYDIELAYFEWLVDLVSRDRYYGEFSYRELLSYLHEVEFTYSIPKDSNRADDGLDLRFRFANQFREVPNADRYLLGPCSVLEMMVALAIRCETTIMDDPKIGDRTGQWFWKMIVNLGLGSMMDNRFDVVYVEDVVSIFLNREYQPDGRGGLFTVKDCGSDLRRIEIWVQLLWYLDTVHMF